jgi:hypothetical protein
VLGAARLYGYELSRFHDCRQDAEAAIDDIARIIDASSAEDPLYFIVAGPMEVPFRGIEKSRPEKRPFVYCISHSRWNDGFASTYKFTNTKRSVIESGVNWVQIEDQNRLLSLSPYGKPGPPESFAPFHWMRDSKDERLRFLFERLVVSTRPDPSDAGMAYFLVSGDEQTDPQKLRALLENHARPTPAIRQRVRLEAENFRQLEGFEIDGRNDRTASHRLSVKHTSGTGGSIQTQYREPYAPTSGRFDVTIRYRQPDSSQAIKVLINGAAASAKVETTPDQQAWHLTTFPDVPITEGDTLTITTAANQISIDYLELTNKNPPSKPGQ